MMDHIAHNLKQVRADIDAAAREAGRDPGSVTLVAVSKTNPREAVEAALAENQFVFGENRVQEAADKFSPPLAGIELHLVGHLQSNKAKLAAELFDRIHSIDSLKKAQRLDRLLGECGRKMAGLIQVNLGEEQQKSGIAKDDVEGLLLAAQNLEHLTIDGLMVLPPFFMDATETAPFFRELRQLRDELNNKHPELGLKHLSMGMTNDYREAIGEGATFIRIGTAIFGKRDYA